MHRRQALKLTLACLAATQLEHKMPLTDQVHPTGTTPNLGSKTQGAIFFRQDGAYFVDPDDSLAYRLLTTADQAALTPDSIVFDNPTATGGTGVLVNHAGSAFTVASTGMSLIYFKTANTGSNQLYTLDLDVDTDTVDTGAALSVTNRGKSDAIYIKVAGKAGAASAPTGIGIDLNRALTGDLERDDENAGLGIQVWDWSTTDQGDDGPTAVLLKKQGNLATEHVLLKLEAQRWAMQFIVSHGSGYTASEPIMRITNGTSGAASSQFRADGQLLFTNDLGLYFEMASGDAGRIYGSTLNTLRLQAGSDGFDFLNNAGSGYAARITNAGAFAIPDGITAPAAVSGLAHIYVDTADGDLKVRFGDGTVAVIAADT